MEIISTSAALRVTGVRVKETDGGSHMCRQQRRTADSALRKSTRVTKVAMPRAISSTRLASSSALVPARLQRQATPRDQAPHAGAQVVCEAKPVGDHGAATLERPWPALTGRLVLEDGSVWRGQAFGAHGTQVGEVVFNTAMTGYQEILTDPSYSGQFVLMTYPHIGNTGVNNDDEESEKCYLGALIIRSLSPVVSNWRASETLDEYLRDRGVMGIAEVDTRAITRRLRITGSMIGVISTDPSVPDEELVKQAKGWQIVGRDLITPVTTKKPFDWHHRTDALWEFSHGVSIPGHKEEPIHVIAYDFGIKHNILRRLTAYGCRVSVVPSTTSSQDVLALKPDGILFSNGPGDPSAVPYAVENARQLIGKVPCFGICMGHQVLGQAFGGKTFKLKFGHHGGNHPVRHLPTGRVEISSQNHNYAVDIDTLPKGIEVTHVNLNDGTCAGMIYPAMKAMSIQYHPEASPGPHDSDPCFEDFVRMMKEHRADVKNGPMSR